MRILHFESLMDPEAISEAGVEDIVGKLRKLLVDVDDEFFPPLSSRKSTTQIGFVPNRNGSQSLGDEGFASVDAYMMTMLEQAAIVIVDDSGENLAGILSYRKDHDCKAVHVDPCEYVSTVIVAKEYRGARLAYDLYAELFHVASETCTPVVTRTWKSEDDSRSNIVHLHILSELGFKEARVIRNDRAMGIDTVYLIRRFDKRSLTMIQKLKAYNVFGSYFIACLLFGFTIVSAILYAVLIPLNELAAELALAFTTSLVVSGFCVFVETTNSYRTVRNDEYLADMKEFGIERLDFDKQALLYERIEESRHLIRISGYRHILTASLTSVLQRASKRDVRIEMLCSPPWEVGYQSVYGNDYHSCVKVLINYIKIMRAILEDDHNHKHLKNCEVRFTKRVMFNDIYCIDETFITSPYSYASEDGSELHENATARNFFTMVVSEDSRLYRLTDKEFEGLWRNAYGILDEEAFLESFRTMKYMNVAQYKTEEDVRNLVEQFKSCIKNNSSSEGIPDPQPLLNGIESLSRTNLNAV